MQPDLHFNCVAFPKKKKLNTFLEYIIRIGRISRQATNRGGRGPSSKRAIAASCLMGFTELDLWTAFVMLEPF